MYWHVTTCFYALLDILKSLEKCLIEIFNILVSYSIHYSLMKDCSFHALYHEIVGTYVSHIRTYTWSVW